MSVFKQQFSVFKQYFTYFNIFFHLHVFLQKFLNNNFQFLNIYTKRALNRSKTNLPSRLSTTSSSASTIHLKKKGKKKKEKKKNDYLVVPIWLLPKPIDVQVQHREVFFFFFNCVFFLFIFYADCACV